MTIYRLYVQNGDRAGFWVQHRTWSNACARIQTIAGQRNGPLPGAAPRHEEAEVVVEAFDVRSGRPISVGPRLQCPRDRNYTQIAEPSWFHQAALEESLAADA
jgi:hypothetical protein